MKEAFWIIDQLIQQGVRHFCFGPGSRSTPLVLAAADHPRATLHVHYDERGVGFYALGINKGALHSSASSSLAAVIATSGTAVGNLLPSVMEAHHTCTPLLLLTADRPSELRDCGANQTTDQTKVFQPFVRWQTDLSPTLHESYFRSTIAQAFYYACQNPPGPVQINCPFRDPLFVPKLDLPEGKPIWMEPSRQSVKKQSSPFAKGIILIGRLPTVADLSPILQLAQRIRWPVFADLLSNGRNLATSEQIQNFDWILKSGCSLKPDHILHFGERLTSKRLLEWMKEADPKRYTHVSPWPFLQDPARLLTERIRSDAAEFCSHFHAETDPEWLGLWKEMDAEIAQVINSVFEEKGPFTEAHAMRSLETILPPEYAVFLGNGMPIRDADHFLFPKIGCKGFFGNRGLSGIDGNIATSAGLSEGLQSPLLSFIGDQAALHDLNSLPYLKKTKHPLLLIVSNNFGGGIFSHLPVSASPHFEKLFAARHGWQFEKAADMFHIPYLWADSDPTEILQRAFQSGESALIELVTSREENYRFQKELAEKCSLALV